MCKKTNYKNTSNTHIDKCMRKEIKEFNRAIELLAPYLENKLKIVACCCGHGKYPKTIVLKEGPNSKDEIAGYFEHFSDANIPRNRNFYKKDAEGYYYIPEVIEFLKNPF
ncbi:MAG: hypothetical protein IMZ60_04080 [Actinobacteria bacterium]|nr:hypothetical protein [Actinomycetota bacterium]